MILSKQTRVKRHIAVQDDALARLANEIERAITQHNYQEAADIFSRDGASSWFALKPARTLEIMRLLAKKTLRLSGLLQTGLKVLTDTTADSLESAAFLTTINADDPREMFMLSGLRMGDFRMKGRVTDALQQGREMNKHLGQMQVLVDTNDGWALHTCVQLGVAAMLAGDFTYALTCFTRAQMHTSVEKYAFLTRDALAKSALIHACFGNSPTAISLIQQADKIQRTSSWVERHIDAHRDFAEILVSFQDSDEALSALEAISLQDIGEMWPFYILAIFRILEANGYHEELEHRLQMFDSMPFPKIDGDGFSGSIIPLKRAMLAIETGRGADAQAFLERADQNLPYTRLFQAAAHVYAGRTQQAIQDLTRLRPETLGFRLMEIRRLSILSAAQYQADDESGCIETLKRASGLPRGLSQREIQLFSPETRELATRRVPRWPIDNGKPSAFLSDLPKSGLALTDREVEIVTHLAQGRSRAAMAEEMHITVNTLKTHLKSIYKKLDVSSAADAVLGAERRGLL